MGYKSRPTLRNDVGQDASHERGESPSGEKQQQDSGFLMTACIEH
jgi:hypothetical protein